MSLPINEVAKVNVSSRAPWSHTSDAPDLADVVRDLRLVGATAVLVLDPPLSLDTAFVRFDDPAGFEKARHELAQTAQVAADPRVRARAIALAGRYIAAQRALDQQPKIPSDDEIVWRFVSGEIDAATACCVTGWGERELADVCCFLGLAFQG